MRAEKKFITHEYVARLNASPFFIVTDYTGLTVGQFTELRKRLIKAGAEVHVVKNSIFCVAAKEAGIATLNGSLAGQIAIVTGKKDFFAAAKAVKTFQAEFEKPKIKFAYLGDQRLEQAQVVAYADFPSIEQLRGKLLGLFQAPAAQLARVLQARVDKEQAPTAQ